MSEIQGERYRLGFYLPGQGTGGPSRYLDAILAGLNHEEFDVTIFGHAHGHYAGRDGMRLVPTEGDRVEGPPTASGESGSTPSVGRDSIVPPTLRLWAGFAGEARRLAGRFAKVPIDLLHTQNTGCEESAPAARLARVPRVVGTFHVDSSYDLDRIRSGFRYRALEHLSNHSLHRAIAVSESTRKDWARRTHLPPGRIVTIPNGVDLEWFRPTQSPEQARAALGLDTDRMWVGGVGRLDDAKGFADLIAAVASIAGRVPALSLVIAGTGPLRDPLGRLASELGVGDRVHFLGFRHDVRTVYEAIDLFAFPSLCEAIGYALLEAMAMHRPAIGTAVGGVPEVIVEGETGLLVPPKDPESLARALLTLAGPPDLRRRMGEAGRRRVERHFDERVAVARTIDLYREMLGTGGGRMMAPGASLRRRTRPDGGPGGTAP